jgi:hypothetical protein
MDPPVIISKGKDPYRTTKRVLERFLLPDLKEKSVLIKPNAARLAYPGSRSVRAVSLA